MPTYDMEEKELDHLVKELRSKIDTIHRLLSTQGLLEYPLGVSRRLGSNETNSCSPFDYYLDACTNGMSGGGSSGDTSFMILCTALVFMMTIPGLGLYYSGMVKVKNVPSAVMQCLSIVAVCTLTYMIFGYSLAFGPPNPEDGGHSSLFYGDDSRFWLWGMSRTSSTVIAPTIPEFVFAAYQLTFAIVTQALICGSIADRISYTSMLLVMALWHISAYHTHVLISFDDLTGVYCPIAHANWHPDGFLKKAGVMDFAGGNVVHISSGCAGFMATLIIGGRRSYDKEIYEPQNVLLTYIGASLLWVGWFGFNAGSALSASALAGQSLLNTQIATSSGAMSWMLLEW